MAKLFPCGHKGKGKFCHLCKQIEEQQRVKETERAKRASIRSHDILTFKGIPINIVSKTRDILEKVEKGYNWQQLQGRKLISQPMISIKVSREYRLLLDASDLTPVKIVSHEEYNKLI